MDCFYAAIEIRDNPDLAHSPVAVGGQPEDRSVLCTCNYIARKFGVRSAMASAYAVRLCPNLIILPVNMQKYQEASQLIHQIFRQYTSIIEPLSLDEAYLDVSNSTHCQGSATWIAQEIRKKIADTTGLAASAGIAPNKFLAKIASGWNKPNGQFVIRPHEVDNFVKELSVEELFGVGKVTAKKMHRLGFKTCSDLQKVPLMQLAAHFGKFGERLYEQCRGIDNRAVEPDRLRKSLSVERTFKNDIPLNIECETILSELYTTLIKRIQKQAPDRMIKNQYLKIKSSDFKLSSIERSCHSPSFSEFKNLFHEFIKREQGSIRLLGIGVHFICKETTELQQQSLL
jgi:DNA polymerase-4